MVTHYVNAAMTLLAYFSGRRCFAKSHRLFFIFFFTGDFAACRSSSRARAAGDVGQVRRDGVLLHSLRRVLGALPHRHQKHRHGMLLRGCANRNHHIAISHLSGSVSSGSSIFNFSSCATSSTSLLFFFCLFFTQPNMTRRYRTYWWAVWLFLVPSCVLFCLKPLGNLCQRQWTKCRKFAGKLIKLVVT